MNDMLSLTKHLPEVTFAAGEVVLREGDSAGAIWVLVSGSLRVVKGGIVVNLITQPGAVVGEVSVLLDTAYGATVEATEPVVMRQAADGRALLASSPAVTTLVAMGLAERLNFITTYLVDLRHQYGDAPGLSMIPDVLRELSQRQRPLAKVGSARDPDPEY
jgi:CRP/FNR family cyclic AMP-dependent transcriptional regulator